VVSGSDSRTPEVNPPALLWLEILKPQRIDALEWKVSYHPKKPLCATTLLRTEDPKK